MEKTRHWGQKKSIQDSVAVSVEQEKSICRGCLVTDRRMVNAMLFEASFKGLTGITISPTDGLPQWLCYECTALLVKYNTFKNKVIKSHYRLCQYVLESVPIALDEDATPHLSRSSVLHCHIAGTQTDKLEERVDDTVKYDTDMLYEELHSVKLNDDPMLADSEDNIVKEEYREETPQIQLASSLPISNQLVINSAFTLKYEELAEEGEASSQAPHVGTEAAQQYLHKHVGASTTSGLDKERQHPADTTATRHSNDTEEEAKHNIHRDDSVNSCSRSNVQSYIFDTFKERFSDKNLIITHIREHSNAISFKCDVCNKHFPDDSTLTKHSHVHTAAKLYQCDVCKKCYRHKGNIIQHLRKHSNEKLYSGDVSDTGTNRDASLSAMHTGDKPYKCNICMKCFGRKQHLKYHMRIHTGDMPYRCDVCMKGFSVKSNLNRHMVKHTDDKPYQCYVCLKRFKENSSLLKHILLHTGDKPHRCDVCTKRFSHRRNLNLHMRIHTGDKPHKCDVCMKCFSQKSHLIKHMLIHTGEKPYKCDVCMKCFTQKSTLIGHFRIHTDDKPYNCNVCLKGFGRKGDLNRHMQVHTGEKLYKCDVCMKRFRQKQQLKYHTRIHTGDKPYECDVCMQRFTVKSSLSRHLRIHTGEMESSDSQTSIIEQSCIKSPSFS